MDTNVRVAKHRVEQSLKDGKPASLNNLQILKNANINIKPSIQESKKIYDSICSKSITNNEKIAKV